MTGPGQVVTAFLAGSLGVGFELISRLSSDFGRTYNGREGKLKAESRYAADTRQPVELLCVNESNPG